MAIEGPGLDIGYLTSTGDMRNSSITGTTLGGPNGSGQFLFVKVSTANDFVFAGCTANTDRAIGVLQNKPAVGEAGDIRFLGVSKLVAGSSAIAPGMDLMPDTDGQAIPWTTVISNQRVARSLNAATAVGQVFSAIIYGQGPGNLPA
jgi:hypothetical protein